MAVGYQSGNTDAFASTQSINGPYVDGLSITYGTPRKHVWTYAIGVSEQSNKGNYICPCSQFAGRLPPSFVHENYYCESGAVFTDTRVFIDDPVWDGKNCSSEDNCCSDPSLPWFYRQLPLAANEDIETRICCDETNSTEDVFIRELQLYIQ